MKRRKRRRDRLGAERQLIGGHLREAREAAGLTQDQVATHLRLPRSAISDIESGTRDVLAVELFELARLFGRPIEAFLGTGEATSPRDDVMLRAEAAGAAAHPEISDFLSFCRLYRELETWAGEGRPASLRPLAGEVATYRDAHRLADEERQRVELGVTPGRVLLDVLEERLSIKVIALSLPQDLSGCSVRNPGFGAAILLNRDHSGGRQVFTLAHEYFHLLTTRQFAATRAPDGVQVCAGQLGRPGDRKPRIEQLADQFAGRLLLPPKHFVERLHGLRKADGTIDRFDLIQVARYFGVSVHAVFVGLARLRLVPWELANAAYGDPELQEAIARAGGEAPPEPARFKRLAARAVQVGKLSRSRLAEVLHLGVDEVDGELARYGVDHGVQDIKLALPR